MSRWSWADLIGKPIKNRTQGEGGKEMNCFGCGIEIDIRIDAWKLEMNQDKRKILYFMCGNCKEDITIEPPPYQKSYPLKGYGEKEEEL